MVRGETLLMTLLNGDTFHQKSQTLRKSQQITDLFDFVILNHTNLYSDDTLIVQYYIYIEREILISVFFVKLKRVSLFISVSFNVIINP